MKKILKEFLAVIFLIAVSMFIIKMAIDTLDAKIEQECSSCDAKFEWCKGYWKEKGLCKEVK